MTFLNAEFLALAQFLSTAGENPSFSTTQKDPLINRGLEDWQYIGIIALAIASLIAVRVLSSRAEYTILFALALSLVLIIFFFNA